LKCSHIIEKAKRKHKQGSKKEKEFNNLPEKYKVLA